MTNKTLVLGSIGLLAGGALGALIGGHIEAKEKSISKGTAKELLGIFGAIAGMVVLPALGDATPQATPLANNTPPTVIPPSGVVTPIPPSGA